MDTIENRIEIVSDDGDVINFKNISITNDVISRTDVLKTKADIEVLESQKQSISDSIVNLKTKVEYCESIIKLADNVKSDNQTVPDQIKNEEV